MPDHNAVSYYARRAPHYDALYAKPERQADLGQLKSLLQTALAGRNVLEIACGTGYWTQALAETALTVTATDINEPMLQIARQKDFLRNNVVFEARDMYDLRPERKYDAIFGGFIWSHIPLQQLETWLDHLHGLIEAGSTVLFADNIFVPGSNTPVSSTDGHGNTFQTRQLPDGSSCQILKNFPEQSDFERLLRNRGQNMQLERLEYYWLLHYCV